MFRQILTDLEDSQLGVLPPSMAEEAQTLRREWEARNRQHPYEPIDYSVRCEYPVWHSSFLSVMRLNSRSVQRCDVLNLKYLYIISPMFMALGLCLLRRTLVVLTGLVLGFTSFPRSPTARLNQRYAFHLSSSMPLFRVGKMTA